MERIGPPDGDETWDNLILRGEVLPAPSGKDLLDEPARDYRFDASTALLQLRDDEH
jgi:hypothetical protein